ncbi:MAG: response regulator [Oscillospiraceae bacterium]|jgi:putative two-component system response regulator|nr:response regulator [Oscillospiraceae bacterium]
MSKPIIIAVDDQKVMCNLIASMLSGTYDIHTFTEGKDALTYMSENPADLVLLDYDMPTMTGYEVLMGIRGDKKNSGIPVIFLTGVTNERMEMEMRDRGANDYICKPIDFTVLRQRIDKHLKSRV